MCRQRIVLILIVALLLSACKKEEEPIVEEVEIPPISEVFQTIDFEELEFRSIGTKCGYTKNSDNIKIYPYFNEDKYVEVYKILISEYKMFEGIANSVSGDAVYKTNHYTIVTMPTGTTYGYISLDHEHAYIFKSDTLPSIYVRAVMNRCRKLNT